MGFSKPPKGVLSLRRSSFDLKYNIRNKLTFSASVQNDNKNKNTEFPKIDKCSSRLRLSKPAPNGDEYLKNVARKPIVTSQTVANLNCALSHMPVYHKVLSYFENVAITDSDGDFLYEDVFRRSCRLAKEIVSALKNGSIDQKICVICPNGLSFVVAQWATWMTGNIFVPLSKNHSVSALEYFVKDCKASLIIGTAESSDMLNLLSKKMEVPLLLLDKTWTTTPVKEFEEPLECDLFDMFFYAERHTALLLYTAGSNGCPTGMLYRHYNLNAQADGVTECWDLDQKSSILNALGTYQTYGIVNALLAPLSVGGRVVMMDKFDPIKVWAYILGVAYNGEKDKYPRTTVDVLPATPDHYIQLYHKYHEVFQDPKQKEFVYNRCRNKMRLMLCSKEELPHGLTDQWREITGHSILQNFSKPKANVLIRPI